MEACMVSSFPPDKRIQDWRSDLFLEKFLWSSGTPISQKKLANPRTAGENKGIACWLPSLVKIEWKDFRCIVMDAPADGFEGNWIQPLLYHGVGKVVSTVEPNYDTQSFAKSGIEVLEMSFADGTEPPVGVVQTWLELVKNAIAEKSCLCVHCYSGLGRAPALVALVLIEMGMPAEAAISHVRVSRRGAISARQVKFLQEYKVRGNFVRRRRFWCL